MWNHNDSIKAGRAIGVVCDFHYASIVRLLTSEFIKLVILACVIEIPFYRYFMADWLQSFAYSIELQWWVFALAVIIALGIAMLTINFQNLRAATANPVNTLRKE